MYYLNHKTLCLTSNPALGSAELPFLVQKNERAPPYFTPLIPGKGPKTKAVRLR